MCMIIDANRLGVFLSDQTAEDARPIHGWLNKGWGNLVYSTGGAFADEVGGRSREKLARYVQAGRATVIPAEQFEEAERQLQNNEAVRSDDPHVLALAIHSRARVLYTGDQRLIRDFKNKQLIDNPRGKIYSGARNAKLLTRSTCQA